MKIFHSHSLCCRDPLSETAVRAADAPIVQIWCRRVALAILCLLWTGTAATAQQPATPDFAVVVMAVEQYFASLANYQAGDLISQQNVAEALEQVRDAGWDVPDADALVQRALADQSFLIGELSKPAGKKFMRKIARHPGTYSRLDRLSSISRGKTVVRDLIRQPGGDEFITYLATTNSGHNLGHMLASAQQGVDLNKPTGRIYTAEDLLAELKRVYGTATP